MHLNYWINKFHINIHENLELLIGAERKIKAEEIFKLRKATNDDLTFLECLQFCDKKLVLKKTTEFKNIFKFSNSSLETFISNAEKIRNELSHNQNTITVGLGWDLFVKVLSRVESFLINSEARIDSECRIY
ncbi:MAG: hypothetical protein IPM92_03405 [Saprospiraceae bacterium]|nr:hypothetical protein [Saprospiraceae bacterium]